MPSPLVLVVYCTPVTSFTATISARTTAALEGSETKPLMFPFGDCANRGTAFTTTQTKKQTIRGKRISALERATDSNHSSIDSHEDPRWTPRDFILILG